MSEARGSFGRDPSGEGEDAAELRANHESVSEPMSVTEAARVAGLVLDEVEKAIVGKREALRLVLAAVLAKGHVLLEDFPASARPWRPGPSPGHWGSRSPGPSSLPTCCRRT